MDMQKLSEHSKLEEEYKKTIRNLHSKIALLENEHGKLKNLIDLFPGDIYWKDRKGIWAGINKHCIRTLITNLYKVRALEKNLDLTLQWDSKLPQFVIGDKTRVDIGLGEGMDGYEVARLMREQENENQAWMRY
ncbi:MAG: hypothetical protein P4L65_03200 [Legionella sp.]|nr:hypothetical protein [Legionella sp.]